jgi:hypothetical protein
MLRTKLFAALAALCLVSACNPSGAMSPPVSQVTGPSTGQLPGTAPDISTNIAMACTSAQQILMLPGTQDGITAGLGAVATSAAGLSAKVGAWCSLGQLAVPILTQALDQVNTAGAQLLGTGVAKQ